MANAQLPARYQTAFNLPDLCVAHRHISDDASALYHIDDRDPGQRGSALSAPVGGASRRPYDVLKGKDQHLICDDPTQTSRPSYLRQDHTCVLCRKNNECDQTNPCLWDEFVK